MGLEDETAQDGRPLLSRVMRQGVRVAARRCRWSRRSSSGARARVAQLPATCVTGASSTGAPYAVRVSAARSTQLVRDRRFRVEPARRSEPTP